MNDLPPFDAYAPRTNCSCPPVPLMWRCPEDSDDACPCRSICVVLLIATKRSLHMIKCGRFVYSIGQHKKSALRSIVRYIACEPSAKLQTFLPASMALALPVTAPPRSEEHT